MHQDLQRLNRYRLANDLSFRALGERVGVPHRTLATILVKAGAQPFERTLFKIQQFLATLPDEQSASQPEEAAR